MTCYDCIHCDACSDAGDAGFSSLKEDVSKCKHFKNKADYVEVKHGHWIKCQKLYGIGYEYVCSVCKKGIRQYEGQPICSECGAKMDGGTSHG